MTHTAVTYGQLDRALRSLGFTRRTVAKDPPAIRYEHAASGALISVPPFADDDAAMEHHLVAARTTLARIIRCCHRKHPIEEHKPMIHQGLCRRTGAEYRIQSVSSGTGQQRA